MAVLINQIVGHDSVKNWFLKQIKNQSLPSSMIFQGPPGVGRQLMARAILQILNCRHSETACGQCSSCLRVLEDQNEMIFRLSLEGKKNIGVDQVREVQSFLHLKSIQPARFVIIDPADALSVSAANSLLKVLEEPSEGVHFVLITDQLHRLLPTIRSRSHRLSFQPLQANELRSYKDFSDLALQWSGGSLPLALELESNEKLEELDRSIQFFYSLLCESPSDWKKVAPWFFNDNEQRSFSFHIWKQALEKRLYGSSENLEFIPEASGTISQLFEHVEFLQSEIGANVDKVLAVENFYYRARPVMIKAWQKRP